VAPPAGADRQQIEDRIRERMKYYAMPFSIEWSADSVQSTPA
jgi:hypothetical protein